VAREIAMNLFEEYKKRREQYGMRAVDAYRSVSHAAAETWRKELRQWDFNVNMIRSNMTETHDKTWVHQLPSGHVLIVLASYDYDVDQLDGLCKVEHHRHKDYREQEVVSHKDGTYWIHTNDGYALVELDDGGIETAWYRKQGMAKQVAIETAIAARKKMVDWIENYVQGNVSYGCFEVRIVRPDEYSDDGENAETVSYAGPLGEVECDDEEYLLDTLNELFNEATHGLTL
jgi:hypothetical protein